jgi:hypothetical protein
MNRQQWVLAYVTLLLMAATIEGVGTPLAVAGACKPASGSKRRARILLLDCDASALIGMCRYGVAPNDWEGRCLSEKGLHPLPQRLLLLNTAINT